MAALTISHFPFAIAECDFEYSAMAAEIGTGVAAGSAATSALSLAQDTS